MSLLPQQAAYAADEQGPPKTDGQGLSKKKSPHGGEASMRRRIAPLRDRAR